MNLRLGNGIDIAGVGGWEIEWCFGEVSGQFVILGDGETFWVFGFVMF